MTLCCRVVLPLFAVGAFVFAFTEAGSCEPNPCKNGGNCALLNDGYNWGYRCTCSNSYKGAQCQWDGDTCSENTTTPCVNGGQCVVMQDGRFCQCPGTTNTTIDFGGHYCEIKNPCATCPSGTYYCQPGPYSLRGRLCLDDRHKVIS